MYHARHNLSFSSPVSADHLLKDILHLLDTSLYQDSVDARRSPAHYSEEARAITEPLFDVENRHILLPQRHSEFLKQTAPDMNR